MDDALVLELLAEALQYPRLADASRLRAGAHRLPEGDVVRAAVAGVAEYLETAPPGEPEERYTALFDLNPVATLHVGYHLFGDSYERGEFLAGLASEVRRHRVSTGEELADFLPTVLRLLAALPEAEDRDLLVSMALLPAVLRMNQALAESEAPWIRVLRVLPGRLLTMAPPREEVSVHA
jgi:nitrate reductase delta subunit